MNFELVSVFAKIADGGRGMALIEAVVNSSKPNTDAG
jgi:hypothetical protein